jgi:hypothetical protein
VAGAVVILGLARFVKHCFAPDHALFAHARIGAAFAAAAITGKADRILARLQPRIFEEPFLIGFALLGMSAAASAQERRLGIWWKIWSFGSVTDG